MRSCDDRIISEPLPDQRVVVLGSRREGSGCYGPQKTCEYLRGGVYNTVRDPDYNCWFEYRLSRICVTARDGHLELLEANATGPGCYRESFLGGFVNPEYTANFYTKTSEKVFEDFTITIEVRSPDDPEVRLPYYEYYFGSTKPRTTGLVMMCVGLTIGLFCVIFWVVAGVVFCARKKCKD